jgi:hypothetical protein
MRLLELGSSLPLFAVCLICLASPAAGEWVPNGTALCTATGTQVSPDIASYGAGGAIVAWQDGRSGTNDVYTQRVTHVGILPGNPVPVSMVAAVLIILALASLGLGRLCASRQTHG